MKRYLACLALGLLLPGCGGGDGPAAPTTPVGPSQARITVSQEGTGALGLSPLADFLFRVRADFRIQESAGLAANFNFIRLSFFLGGREVERREIGASSISAALGTNRIAASSNQVLTMRFDFNSEDFDRIALAFNFTDDRGNILEATLDDIQVEPVFGVITGAATPDGFGAQAR